MIYAVVTRACMYDTNSYEVGDEIENHDVADKLILLGFADHPGPDVHVRKLDEEIAALGEQREQAETAARAAAKAAKAAKAAGEESTPAAPAASTQATKGAKE